MASANKIQEYIQVMELDSTMKATFESLGGPLFNQLMMDLAPEGASDKEKEIIKEEFMRFQQRMAARFFEYTLERLGAELSDEEIDQLIAIIDSPIMRKSKELTRRISQQSIDLMVRMMQEEAAESEVRILRRLSQV